MVSAAAMILVLPQLRSRDEAAPPRPSMSCVIIPFPRCPASGRVPDLDWPNDLFDEIEAAD